jgi:hypothetical protein
MQVPPRYHYDISQTQRGGLLHPGRHLSLAGTYKASPENCFPHRSQTGSGGGEFLSLEAKTQRVFIAQLLHEQSL